MMLNILETIRASITLGEESGYVAECRDIAIVTQGRTLDEVTLNLREAVALYFEGEDVINILQSFGFQVQSQKGSHIQLRRLVDGQKETLIIPNHRQFFYAE